MIAFFAFVSCEKEKTLSENEYPQDSLDLMRFDNVESFKAHFEMMDRLYDDNSTEFYKLAKENPVKTPLQITLNDKFTNPDERYDTFMDDQVMTAIVNEYFEFQIEEILLTVVDKHIILTSQIDNDEARNQIRLFPKGEYVNLNELPNGVFPVTDDSFEDLLLPWDGSDNYSLDNILKSYKKSMTCKVDGSTESIWFSNFSHMKAMTCKTHSFKSWGRTKEEAIMYCYSQDPITYEWELSPAYTSVKIDADRRNSSCSSTNPDDKTKGGYNTITSARVSKWGKQYHQNNDVKGEFSNGFVGNQTQTVPY